MFLSLPLHPEPQMTYLQDAIWSQFQAQANAASNHPWVLPGSGQEDADSWELRGLVTKFSTPPPHPTYAHTATSTCAEVFTLVQRCGSKCCAPCIGHLCTHAPPEGAFKYHSNSAKPNPHPLAPAPAWGCWWSWTGQRGTPHISRAWAVPAEAQY